MSKLESSSLKTYEELKASRAALAVSEGRLHAILGGATDYAVITMDFSGRVDSWSAGASRIFGWKEAEVLGQDAALIWTQEDRNAGAPEVERIETLAKGSIADERWYVRRDGTQIWASGHLTPLAGEGTPGFLKILQDRTERHHTDTAVNQSEARLQRLTGTLQAEITQRAHECDRIWQLSPDLLLVARLDATLVAVNPAWSTILGWTETESVGRLALEMVHPGDREGTLAVLARLAAGLPVQRFLNRYQHRNGSWRWLTWTALPDKGLIYATGRDVTDEYAASAALPEAEKQRHRSQRMETMGRLTSGVAHDFNNLLQGIGNNLDMVQLRVKEGRVAEAGRYAETAHKGVDRAAALTARLLAFARRQPLQTSLVNPGALILGTAELIERTMGPGITVELRLLDDTWPVLCDPSRLENALLNLAINARDAMPEGGLLTISTCHVFLAEADVTGQDGATAGDYVETTVTDTGTGMTPAVLAAAFDPYFTTKPVDQGTGLGLSQLHSFVRDVRGVVQLDSAPGQGTTVRFYLPRHEA